MKKINLIVVSLIAFVAIIIPNSVTAQSSIVVKTNSVENSDITFRPMLPIQDSKTEIAVTCHNTTANKADNVKVSISDENKKIIGEKIISIDAKSKKQIVFPWIFKENGYQKLTVNVVDKTNKSVASIVAPVISRPLYFPWFGGHTPEARALKYSNIVLSGSTENHNYWRNRGAIPCLWKGVDKNISAEAYAKDLAKGLSGDATNGPAGIMIDEMGGYSPEEILNSNYFKGLSQFLEDNSQYFTALWICGSLQYPYCNISKNVYRQKVGIDLLMLEVYTNYQTVEFSSSRPYAYFDQRINMARQQDVLSNTIMTLAIDGHADKFNLLPYQMEDEVRYIRRHAPEMPGLGFFHFETKSPELVPVADDLCRKYYIESVLNIYPEDIQFSSRDIKRGDEITIFAGFRNLGGMDAKDVTLNLYVNNKLIKSEKVTLPALKTAQAPRAIQLKANWKASDAGYYDIRAELIPNSAETVLDGTASQKIWVRK